MNSDAYETKEITESGRVLKWINLAAFIVMIGVNILAFLLPLAGVTTSQVSEKYANLFTPAGITFAIWGVIYVCLMLFVIYQLGLMSADTISSLIRSKIGPWFIISCILNTAWIFLWHYDFIGLSVIIIAALLVSLIIIEKRLESTESTSMSRFMVKAGFDIYFGWIVAAVIANICAFLTKIGWNGFGLPDQFWTVVVLLIAAAIGTVTVLVNRRWLSGLAIIWASIGILIRHISASGLNGRYPIVIVAAIVGIVIILNAILCICLRNHCCKKQS